VSWRSSIAATSSSLDLRLYSATPRSLATWRNCLSVNLANELKEGLTAKDLVWDQCD
jgi:hypothetical protein